MSLGVGDSGLLEEQGWHRWERCLGGSSEQWSASFPISKISRLPADARLAQSLAEVWLGPAYSLQHDAELVGRFRTARESRGRGWPASFPSADDLRSEPGGGAPAGVWGTGRRPLHGLQSFLFPMMREFWLERGVAQGLSQRLCRPAKVRCRTSARQ